MFLVNIAALLISFANSYDLRIGLIAPADQPKYNPTFGLGTSCGAVGLALDRIQREQIIPDANIRQTVFRYVIKHEHDFNLIVAVFIGVMHLAQNTHQLQQF